MQEGLLIILLQKVMGWIWFPTGREKERERLNRIRIGVEIMWLCVSHGEVRNLKSGSNADTLKGLRFKNQPIRLGLKDFLDARTLYLILFIKTHYRMKFHSDATVPNWVDSGWTVWGHDDVVLMTTIGPVCQHFRCLVDQVLASYFPLKGNLMEIWLKQFEQYLLVLIL